MALRSSKNPPHGPLKNAALDALCNKGTALAEPKQAQNMSGLQPLHPHGAPSIRRLFVKSMGRHKPRP
jgi:hypothetical protein